jgi:hypothetical protein
MHAQKAWIIYVIFMTSNTHTYFLISFLNQLECHNPEAVCYNNNNKCDFTKHSFPASRLSALDRKNDLKKVLFKLS